MRRSHEAITALGGGIDYIGRPGSSTKLRAELAAELYENSVGDTIIFTGRWTHRKSVTPPITEAEVMARLVAHRLPASVVRLERRAQDTIGNAYYSAVDHILPLGVERVALVTSRAHAPRAQWLFHRALGPDVAVDVHTTSEEDTEVHVLKETRAIYDLEERFGHVPAGDLEQFRAAAPYLEAPLPDEPVVA